MTTEIHDPHVAAVATLALLEIRLRRIEFLLTGSANANGIPTPVVAIDNVIASKDTVAGRLQQLQDDLNKIRRSSGPVGDLIKDIESLHTQTPEIFTDPLPRPLTSLSDQTRHIFANTSLYTETASRLSSLQTLPVPPAEQSSQLVVLKPRIDAAKAKQEDLEAQARELRERSARCLEWWVKYGVVGMDELWSDWEDRVHETERTVTRMERARAEQEGYI